MDKRKGETGILREAAITNLARLALLWFLLTTLPVRAETSPVQISPDSQSVDLTFASWVLEDPEGKLTLDVVRDTAVASRFKLGSPSPGFTPSAYWFRFTLRGEGSTPSYWWLDIGDRFMQEVDVFSPDANGVYLHQSASSGRPFFERPIHTAKFTFPILLPAEKSVDIFLRVRSTGHMPIAIYPELWKPDAHREAARLLNYKWVFYLGMAAALILFNSLLFLFIRDSNYLRYVLAQIAIVWWISTSRFGSGLAFEYIWPESPLFEQISLMLSTTATGYCAYLFQSRLMELPRFRPKLERYWKATVWVTFLFLIFIILGTVLPQVIPVQARQAAFRYATIAGMFFFAFNAYSIYAMAQSGNRAAKILAIAWSPVILILAYAFALSFFSVRINWAIPPLMLASGLEMIFMSLALADRVNQARKEKALAQAELLEGLRESERQLEIQVAQRTEELRHEQVRTKELLYNILPIELADELSATGHASSARHESVTVLFTDFSGFTLAASTMPADRMVSELNEIFAAFDDICDELGIEKIKTIGDAYMAAAGLPKPCADHAQRCVAAGLRMAQYIEQRNHTAAFKWSVRIGIHSGSVVAGVVGKRKYAFDIWGNTVNVASRMESSGEVGRVNVSAYTYDLIKKDYECEYRGKVSAKGKGEIDMYFVKGPTNLKDSMHNGC